MKRVSGFRGVKLILVAYFDRMLPNHVLNKMRRKKNSLRMLRLNCKRIWKQILRTWKEISQQMKKKKQMKKWLREMRMSRKHLM